MMQRTPSQSDERHVLLALFTKFDGDGNGMLSIAETQQMIDELDNAGLAISEAKAAELFSAMDADGDGQVDFDEFYDLVSLVRSHSLTGVTKMPASSPGISTESKAVASAGTAAPTSKESTKATTAAGAAAAAEPAWEGPKFRNPKESYTEMNKVVSVADCDEHGVVRAGQVLKWIDLTALACAWKHSSQNAVTNGMDRIQFRGPAFAGECITLRGSVNRVFKNRMEIQVELFAEPLPSSATPLASASSPLRGSAACCNCNCACTASSSSSSTAAYFAAAAASLRAKGGRRSLGVCFTSFSVLGFEPIDLSAKNPALKIFRVNVPDLVPETSEEKIRWEAAESRRLAKQEREISFARSVAASSAPAGAAAAAGKTSSKSKESAAAIATASPPPSSASSSSSSSSASSSAASSASASASASTSASTSASAAAAASAAACAPCVPVFRTLNIVLPADTNPYSTCFGGVLMDWVDAAATMAAVAFAKRPFVTASVDEIVFRAPAFIGDMVELEAVVTRSFGDRLEVFVQAFASSRWSQSPKRLVVFAYLTLLTTALDLVVAGTSAPAAPAAATATAGAAPTAAAAAAAAAPAGAGAGAGATAAVSSSSSSPASSSLPAAPQCTRQTLPGVVPQTEMEKKLFFEAGERRRLRVSNAAKALSNKLFSPSSSSTSASSSSSSS